VLRTGKSLPDGGTRRSRTDSVPLGLSRESRKRFATRWELRPAKKTAEVFAGSWMAFATAFEECIGGGGMGYQLGAAKFKERWSTGSAPACPTRLYVVTAGPCFLTGANFRTLRGLGGQIQVVLGFARESAFLWLGSEK